MPEISRFFGIIIYMYFNAHNPPHFHVQYNEYRAKLTIDTLMLLDGDLPARVLGLVLEWAKIHQTELQINWDTIIATGQYSKIQPLV
jgi:hypothetical protein